MDGMLVNRGRSSSIVKIGTYRGAFSLPFFSVPPFWPFFLYILFLWCCFVPLSFFGTCIFAWTDTGGLIVLWMLASLFLGRSRVCYSIEISFRLNRLKLSTSSLLLHPLVASPAPLVVALVCSPTRDTWILPTLTFQVGMTPVM